MIVSAQTSSQYHAFVIFVSGIFGMNLKSYLEEHVVSAILLNSSLLNKDRMDGSGLGHGKLVIRQT